MSEPIPESIPTSVSNTSRRPAKKLRASTSNKPTAAQASQIFNLMSNSDIPINLPSPSTASTSKGYQPPEIVANVQGSSAGAGSGEFHVYKASRRREYERLRGMDEEAKREEEDAKWEKERRVKEEKEEREREKKRRARERKKNRGGKGKEKGEDASVTGDGEGDLKKGDGIATRTLQLSGTQRNGVQQNDDSGTEHEVQATYGDGAREEIGVVIHDDNFEV